MASDNARAASTPSQRQPKVLIASLFLPVALEQAVVDDLTTREAHRRARHRTNSSSSSSSQYGAAPVSTDGDNVVASSAFVRSPRRESLGNMLSSSSSLYAIDVYDEDEPLEPETKLRIVPSTLGNVGLQNAVNSMPRDELNCLWIGSMGPGYDDLYAQSNSAQSPPNSPSFTPSMKAEVDAELLAKHHAVNVELTDAEIHGHYHDFCKQILWPLFHSQAPDYASVSRYESTGWDMYRRVNVKFADAIAKAYQPGDTVWVNDYHLMLLPNLLRKRIPTAAVGFFLHIPFPSDEFFRCLHVRKDIVEGVLAANLIGFQTYSYTWHFSQACGRILNTQTTYKSVVYNDHHTTIGSFPMGIDTRRLEKKLSHTEVNLLAHDLTKHYQRPSNSLFRRSSTVSATSSHPRSRRSSVSLASGADCAAQGDLSRLHSRHNSHVGSLEDDEDVSVQSHDMKVIVARDKLGYIKGVKQKLMAYELFLQTFPEWVGKVVMVQVALSTGGDPWKSATEVSDIASRINSRFGRLEYTPLVYLRQDISYHHYLALLSIADACLITPLRDGMNLTSHEYIVCQKRKTSPLIMSEFAGTYGCFGSALRVNPWDYREVAAAINQALSMTSDEKLERWVDLYRTVTTYTAQAFVKSFLCDLRSASS